MFVFNINFLGLFRTTICIIISTSLSITRAAPKGGQGGGISRYIHTETAGPLKLAHLHVVYTADIMKPLRNSPPPPPTMKSWSRPCISYLATTHACSCIPCIIEDHLTSPVLTNKQLNILFPPRPVGPSPVEF